MDSDDEWLPDKLKKQVQIMIKNNHNPHIVIHSDAILKDTINNTGRLFGINKVEGDNVYSILLQQPSPMFQSIFTSKLALKEIGYLDVNIPSYQEWDTCIRLAKKCKFIQMQEPTFIYYYHSGETISKDKVRDIRGYDYIINKYKSEMLKFASKNTYRNHIINQYNRCVMWGLNKMAFKYFLQMCIGDKLKILGRTILTALFTKERQGNKRTIAILLCIKFSYNKQKL